ncbi:MAG: hypothetical protein Kow0031_38750 [Anaerolineae bacterium]
MDKTKSLMEQIERLSAESRAELARYVEYLQWREAAGQAATTQQWSFSFVEAFSQASVHATDRPAGMDVKMAPATVGGDSRPALWAHPPLSGQTVLEYYVPVPKQVAQIRLKVAIGIRDGAEIAENNLVAFGVKVNGLRVWGQQTNAQRWENAVIPLKIASGDMVRVEFTTEALGSHKWTWAVWGNPELIGEL